MAREDMSIIREQVRTINKRPSNADRIRSMSDAELAEFVSGTDFCELLCNDTPVCIDGQCFARLLNWLRQEAKDA